MRTGSTSYRARLAASVTALVGLAVVSGCAPRTVTNADRVAPTVTAPQPVAVQQPVITQPAVATQQPIVNRQPIVVQQGTAAPSIPLESTILNEVETVEGDFERIYIPPLPSTN